MITDSVKRGIMHKNRGLSNPYDNSMVKNIKNTRLDSSHADPRSQIRHSNSTTHQIVSSFDKSKYANFKKLSNNKATKSKWVTYDELDSLSGNGKAGNTYHEKDSKQQNNFNLKIKGVSKQQDNLRNSIQKPKETSQN